MSFASNMQETTMQYVAEIASKNTAISEWKKATNTYTGEVIRAKCESLADERKAIIEKAREKLARMTNDYIKASYEADRLNGENLTADAELLSGEYNITGEDISAMMTRAYKAGNRTMQRLIGEYAIKHNLEVTPPYYTAAHREKDAINLRDIAFAALESEWHAAFFGSEKYFRSFCPASLYD